MSEILNTSPYIYELIYSQYIFLFLRNRYYMVLLKGSKFYLKASTIFEKLRICYELDKNYLFFIHNMNLRATV